MSASDLSLSQLLDRFSAPTPTPGGGSAAALTGAIGVSLLSMVAGLPKTKTGAASERAALDDARTRLLDLRHRLVDLVDRDSAAYDLVVLAYRLPKSTDAEKAARARAVQSALCEAAEAPLQTMRACGGAMAIGQTVAALGNASAKTDVAVGAQTLMTALQGAWLNVEANLSAITDADFVRAMRDDVKAVIHDAGQAMVEVYRSGGIAELLQEATAKSGIAHHAAPGAPAGAEQSD